MHAQLVPHFLQTVPVQACTFLSGPKHRTLVFTLNQIYFYLIFKRVRTCAQALSVEMSYATLPLPFLFQRGQESSGFSCYMFYYIHQKTYFLYSGEYSGECRLPFQIATTPHFMLEDI